MLSKTKIILVEILDEKTKFNEKYNKVVELLNKYGFVKFSEKSIISLSIFSKCKSTDVLFKKLN